MKKFFTMIAAVLMMAALVACGPSDEKMAELTEALSLMTEAGEAARETFLDITDPSMKSKLDELAAREEEIKALEFEKMNDKKVDAILPQIAEITEEYRNLDGQLNEVLTAETAEKTEKSKHKFQQVFFTNKTGMNLTEIRLHDLTQDTYSDNFLGNGVMLEAGYTLMGPALDVYSDSSHWEFVVKSEADTEYVLACDSLLPVDLEGISITLSYDSKTEEGSATFGNYTSPLASEASSEASFDGTSEDTTGEAASEASSN